MLKAPSYRREMQNLYVPHQAYANVCGSDLIRQPDGAFAVLEDNLRVPSGVSVTRAASFSTRRCCETAERVTGMPAASAPTDDGRTASRST